MKQIEEMAKDLAECYTIDEWAAREYGEAYTDFEATAEKLAEKGYRKQSEVAREIFEEIEKEVASKIPMIIQPIFKDDRDFAGGFINGKTDALIDVLVLVAELKNKYTEVEK